MKKQYGHLAASAMQEPAQFYCGCRKILRNLHFDFDFDDFMKKDLNMADLGFTKSKTTMLNKYYMNEESIAVAQELWNTRISTNKYGSAGVSTYNHFRKGKSNMGPCIQSILFTQFKKGQQEIDVLYRTTEIFKKLPADFVWLRDSFLPQFDTSNVDKINFHFVNATVHPMYFATLIPHLKDPVATLRALRKTDEYFWKWCVKWTARYIVPKHFNGIDKFSQAMRTRATALELINSRDMKALQKYLSDNHPGYSRGKLAEDEDDDHE